MSVNFKKTESLLRMPGVHTIERPVGAVGGEVFDLAYVREGPRGGTPLVVVPGGPGLCSVLPYPMLRRSAAARGFDVVMVEHRGIGLSRRDSSGADLPPDAVTVPGAADDLAAVLDACGIGRALVWGSSYGAYLGQAFAARHPDRVSGMVLDSPLVSAGDYEAARRHARALLWDGALPETAGPAARLRALVDAGAVPAEETGRVVPVVYEFGGAPMVSRLLAAAERGRRGTWRRVLRLAERDAHESIPNVLEFDRVGTIWNRGLAPPPPDGRPLDIAHLFPPGGNGTEDARGEPMDLTAEQRGFDFPVALLNGARDLRTVRPAAEESVARMPDAVLMAFPDSGHSFLDRFPFAGLVAAGAVAAGRHRALPRFPERLEATRGLTTAKALTAFLSVSLTADGVPPGRHTVLSPR